jgi:hypothetical protein
MFDSFEVRKVANGYVLQITTADGETKEYVFDTARKLLRMLKPYLGSSASEE